MINEIPNKVKDLLVVSPVLGRVFGWFLWVDFAPFVLITVNFFSSWTAEVLISFSLEANAVLILVIIANLLKWFTVNCKFPFLIFCSYLNYRGILHSFLFFCKFKYGWYLLSTVFIIDPKLILFN